MKEKKILSWESHPSQSGSNLSIPGKPDVQQAYFNVLLSASAASPSRIRSRAAEGAF